MDVSLEPAYPSYMLIHIYLCIPKRGYITKTFIQTLQTVLSMFALFRCQCKTLQIKSLVHRDICRPLAIIGRPNEALLYNVL